MKSALGANVFQVRSMNTIQRAELAEFLRQQTASRLGQFDRAGRVGYAGIKLIRDWNELMADRGYNFNIFDQFVKKGKLSQTYARVKNPQNIIFSEIVLMQDFLSSQTSTVKGWKEHTKKWDDKVFGGKYEMDDFERIIWWDTYQELVHSGWTSITGYDSDQIKLFATHWRVGEFDRTDLNAAVAAMKNLLNRTPDILPEHPPGRTDDAFQQDLEGGDDGFDFRDGLL